MSLAPGPVRWNKCQASLTIGFFTKRDKLHDLYLLYMSEKNNNFEELYVT